MLEFFDYETLRLIWWALLGFLLIGFALTDGFDLGIGILLPFVARNDNEKRVLLNTIAPVWEGNQVWLILGAGAIFAAWPYIYAVAFSGFYFAMLLVLLALILRPVGFDYRSKIDNKTWRSIWDCCIFIAGFVPSLVFGIAVGNTLCGVPFGFNDFMVMENKMSFLGLLTPFPLLCGILSVAMLATHGACYLAMKTEGKISKRVNALLKIMPALVILLFACGGFFLKILPSYHLQNFAGTLAASDPLHKSVTISIGHWFDNYEKYRWFVIAPIAGFVGQILLMIFNAKNQTGKAFISSAISIIGIIATVGLTMFPFILPSSLNPNASLTIWDASSSEFTLLVMLIAVIIFIPIILIYTSAVYRIMRGKVTEKDIEKDSKFLY